MLHWIVTTYFSMTKILETYFMPALVLLMRVLVGKIFFYSGLTKISSWSSTLALFHHEYKVPFILPEVAAYLTTATELITPVLLLFGFATRFATVPMLVMTAVIQFSYDSRVDHLYWAMLLGVILFYGPGIFSIDALIKRGLKKWFVND